MQLGAGYNSTSFAVMTGVKAKLGYKFNPGFSVGQIEGGYQYMSRSDFIFRSDFAHAAADRAEPWFVPERSLCRRAVFRDAESTEP